MSFISQNEADIYSLVKKSIKHKKVSAENVVYLLGVIMEITEKTQAVNKKEITINILKEVVRLTPSLTDEQKTTLYLSIDLIAPGAIDLIVAGASGKLNINMEPITACGCFGSSKQPPERTGAKSLLESNIKSSRK